MDDFKKTVKNKKNESLWKSSKYVSGNIFLNPSGLMRNNFTQINNEANKKIGKVEPHF